MLEIYIPRKFIRAYTVCCSQNLNFMTLKIKHHAPQNGHLYGCRRGYLIYVVEHCMHILINNPHIAT